jgi:hypothetical protein
MQALIDWDKNKLLLEDVDTLLRRPRFHSFDSFFCKSCVKVRCEEMDRRSILASTHPKK